MTSSINFLLLLNHKLIKSLKKRFRNTKGAIQNTNLIELRKDFNISCILCEFMININKILGMIVNDWL